MRRASQGVFAKQVWPGIRHSSSDDEGHHCRWAQVSAWMSAKDEPQKNLYLCVDCCARATLRRADSDRASRAAEHGIVTVPILFSRSLLFLLSCC